MSETTSILQNENVREAASLLRNAPDVTDLSGILRFAKAMAEARGDGDSVEILVAELEGYETHNVEIPDRRRAIGFASSFPVRAIGHLDPEEIFLANRDKFAQVSLTMGQAVTELIAAIQSLDDTGVIELRVPASEISGDAAYIDPNSEIHIYILPNEILKIIHSTERFLLRNLVRTCIEESLAESDPE